MKIVWMVNLLHQETELSDNMSIKDCYALLRELLLLLRGHLH